MAAPYHIETYDLHDLKNYFLVRRIGATLPQTSHSVPASGALSTFDPLSPTAIAFVNGQAARIRGGVVNCAATLATNQKLICQSLNLALFGQAAATNTIRGWQLNAVGYPLMGNGVTVNIPADEPLFFDDFAEIGGMTPSLQLAAQADVTNTDGASAHSYVVNAAVVIEIWQYSPRAMSGG